MNVISEPDKGYCNCLAVSRGLDPVGYAGSFDDAIIVEAPLPWKRDIMQQSGAFPQQIIDLLALWLQQYYQTGQYRHRPLVIAPDEDYSRQGYRRVLHYTRPQGIFTRFDKIEYHVPDNELGSLVWALYEDRDALPHFDIYRAAEADLIRDILVCTHGTVDAACAKFGYPLYRHMRDTYASESLRVWRVSHFGGHVFAPTLMDMPTGHYWAYVENRQAEQIIQRSGDVTALRGHYRGWAGMTDSFQQTAECALWQQHGWEWFDYSRSGETVKQDSSNSEPLWAEVCLRYAAPGMPEITADLQIEVSHTVETQPSTGKKDTYAYPQYRVTKTERTS